MNIWSIVIDFAIKLICEIIDPSTKKKSISRTEDILELVKKIQKDSERLTRHSDRIVIENGKAKVKRSEHKNDFFGQGDPSDLNNEEFWGPGGFWGDKKPKKKKKVKLPDASERLENIVNELKNKTTKINLNKDFSRKSIYATVKSGDNINVKESVHEEELFKLAKSNRD